MQLEKNFTEKRDTVMVKMILDVDRIIHMCLAHSALHAIHFYHNFFHCCSSSVLLLSAYILYQLHPFLRMYCKKLLMLHVQFMQYRVRKMPVIARPVFFSHL